MSDFTDSAVGVQDAPAATLAVPSKKSARSVRVVLPIGSQVGGDGLIRISTPDKSASYWTAEVPSALPGRAFSLKERGKVEAPEYTCHVGGHRSCECLGWLRWGKCKHVDALAALVATELV